MNSKSRASFGILLILLLTGVNYNVPSTQRSKREL